MTNNNNDSDPDFYFPLSSSTSIPIRQKKRKKRTKLIKLEPSTSTSGFNSAEVCISNINLPSKPKYYAKKPDPFAPKITRPCSECGKKFWSWKALFGHMRCHPERQWRGINPPPNYRRPSASISPIQEELASVEDQDNMTAEDHEVASCLLLLANSDPIGSTILETDQCGDAGGGACSSFHAQDDVINCRFECSSCKKVFGSHQALGGHRASHKNVKGCFAITRSDGSDGCDMGEDTGAIVDDNSTAAANNKMLMVLGHKCSICLRVFSSGQALGGHKRCHWEKGGEEASSSSSMVHQLRLNSNNMFAAKEGSGLDLNLPLPAPAEDESSYYYSSGLALDLRLGL